MRRILREPILHILLAGVAIFAVDAALRDNDESDRDDRIVVPAGRVENLAALFERTWQRPPSNDELQTLVDDYVLEEALYREGLAIGLDQDDTVIRRRIRQKMEFVMMDLVASQSPGEDELQAWFETRQEEYRIDPSFSFLQVVVDPARHEEPIADVTKKLLAQLQELEKPEMAHSLGDRTLLDFHLLEIDLNTLQKSFGNDFAAALAELPLESWSGPLQSTYGLHFVYLVQRTQAWQPELTEVRSDVLRDFEYQQANAARARLQQDLLGRYDVSVEWPSVDETPQESQP